MKKIAFLLAVVMLATVAMTSCAALPFGAPDTVEKLMERIDNRMDRYDSYKATTEIEMVAYVSGNKIEATGSGSTVTVGDEDDKNYAFYQEYESHTECDELDIDESAVSVKAFYDGKMFVSTKSEDIDQRFYSEMSAEAFADHLERVSPDLESELLVQCDAKDFVRNDDKSWKITLSGYSDKALEKISDSLSVSDGILGGEIKDVNITVFADKKFNITSVSMEFVFDADNADETPKVSAKISYSELGEAKAVELKASDYKKVDNVAILSEVTKMLSEAREDTDGAADIKTTQNVTINGKNVPIYTQEIALGYGEKEGKFFYNASIKGTGDAAATEVSYSNGEETTKAPDSAPTKLMRSEQEARALVTSLLNSAQYDEKTVTAITKKSDKFYVLDTLVPDEDEFDSLLEGIGAKYKSSSKAVSVTVKNDKVASIKSHVEVSAVTTGTVNSNITVIIVSEIVFK